ncbi:UNVERIFIED_ORG: hypothetical protein M2438_005401 [Methylobacterium sp. SuP10 SLI 274]|uniref:hypothetical protein n=1 Tax=Methylorubrum extorquens TaxID=408 RepID=UPI00209D1F4D|nr:hypothetical protein [Methylorubrum extorquens]MDF9866399.1 hypothetical protein [Methylorubrum pseudosasae]MDH6640155.1 hypothetical protein [Methylobacterium sp. SuP10 SLI 274]MDH6669336.1 hypothetical protein [Methylorubrum zatmanii]MCP1561894.1 hypothetical protein [Methylorubrum extorquens]MDF9794700.1 hypothetical protein [Methylorubrum extorquens]
MSEIDFDKTLESLVEELAAIEHDRWSHWQKYVHSKAARQPDGSLVIPAELVTRWDKQISTTYAELSDKEKESDREQVRNYIPIIIEALKKQGR